MLTVPKPIDALIQQHLDDIFTACAVTVYQHGKPIMQAGWGYSDTPHDMYSVTHDETLFDLASVTKLFVETTLLAQVSAGRITLDTPLVEVFPEFDSAPRPIIGGKNPHTKADQPTAPHLVGQTVTSSDVTFRHLITHTSGLAPWMDVYNAAGAAPNPPTQIDPIPRDARWRKAQAYLARAPFVDAVGAEVHYSDLGLMLIGLSIERLTGQPLADAVRDAVTAPLGIADHVRYNPVRDGLPITQTVPTEPDPLWRKRRVWGDVHDENACGIGGVAGHAGLFGTSDAVAVFGEAWRTRDPRLSIDPALMDAAVVNQSGKVDAPYGYGWVLRIPEGSSAGTKFSMNSYGHTGFTGTSLWIDPEREIVASLMTNRVYMGREKVGITAFRQAFHDLLVDVLSS